MGQSLVRAIFGQSELPSRDPDYVFPGGGPQVGDGEYMMNGLPGPGSGTFSGNVKWANNLTAFVWTLRSSFLELNTTVFHSLNTSSRPLQTTIRLHIPMARVQAFPGQMIHGASRMAMRLHRSATLSLSTTTATKLQLALPTMMVSSITSMSLGMM